MPLVVMIEVISFLSRPISLSVRLFANMLAGSHHAEGVRRLRRLARQPGRAWHRRRHSAAHHDRGADRLEFLVAFLQAYVFAVLTCMYLNDALHPGH
jgi:F-type H+-transporting ATPase subunit a